MIENEELNSQISKRLREVAQYLATNRIALTDKELAQLIGVNPTTLSLVMNGKARATEKFVLKLCQLCKNLNFEWIMSGEGAMLKQENPSSEGLNSQPEGGNLTSALQTIDKLVGMMAEKDRQIGRLIDLMAAEKNNQAAPGDAFSAAAGE